MQSIDQALRRFDDAFTVDRAHDVTDLLAEDCRALVHLQDPVEGRDAVVAAFERFFAAFEPIVYESDYDVADVAGDRAYVLGSVHQVLRPHTGGPNVEVYGRVVLFWRRSGGQWLITRMLTARSAPDRIEE